MLTGVNDLTTILNPQRRTNVGDGDQELGQDEYFALMIAQLRNQDPTKPQDGSEYLSQIDQFGTVNGIQELEKSFAELASAISGNQALSASNLIDREVLLPGGFGYLGADGEPLNGQIALPQDASRVRVEIKDESGRTIRVLDLGGRNAGASNFSWDGLDDAGRPAAPGRYNIEALATIGNEQVAIETNVAARVEAVSFGGLGGQTLVTVAGLGTVSLADVRGIQ
ncbi:MAG: flagellar hook assembly protein FlgD [Pseudomonadota bacterium]